MRHAPQPSPKFQQIGPLELARMTKCRRAGGKYTHGRCLACDGKKSFSTWRGDDGRTMIHCFRCRDFDAIAAELRHMGYTTTEVLAWGERRGAKIGFNVSWQTSPAFLVLTKTELLVDALIGAVKPNEAGVRFVPVREIMARVPSDHYVPAALRVLKIVGRWQTVAETFVARNGCLRRRNGYVEGGWQERFAPFGDDELERRAVIEDAKAAAKKARNHRVPEVEISPERRGVYVGATYKS